MRINAGILLLFLCGAVAAQTDDTQGHVYDNTVRMHASPFDPNTHAPPEERKPVAPSIGRRGLPPAPASTPLGPDVQPSMPLPTPPERALDTDRRRQENWITPAAQTGQKTEVPEESGWGWLADQTSRKLAEQQRIRTGEPEESEPGRAEDTQREERQTVRDSTFFMSSDYFNNAGMFDTAAQFNPRTEEEEAASEQPGGSDMIRATADDLRAAAGTQPRPDKTADVSADEPDTSRSPAYMPEGIGITGGGDREHTARYSLSPEISAPREALSPVTFSPAAYAPPAAPSAVRIPSPAVGGGQGFSRIAPPASPSAPAGITRPTGFSGTESLVTRPSLMPSHDAMPSAVPGMPAAGSLQAPSAGPAGKSLYDAREESGMRLLPQ